MAGFLEVYADQQERRLLCQVALFARVVASQSTPDARAIANLRGALVALDQHRDRSERAEALAKGRFPKLPR